MKYINMFVLVGLVVILGTGLIFYLNVGLGNPISENDQNWAAFGSYFGGVVGALLSFVSILLLVVTIRQQSEQIQKSEIDSRKLELLNFVGRADIEIEQWLKIRLAVRVGKPGMDVEFGLVVWGIVSPCYVNSSEVKSAFDRLIVLTEMYSAAIAQCSTEDFLVIKQHKQKCVEILKFLKSKRQMIDSNDTDGIKNIETMLEQVV
ncbi:hypothetical protein ACFL53_03765 [Pseudomonadota bacterium]